MTSKIINISLIIFIFEFIIELIKNIALLQFNFFLLFKNFLKAFIT